MTVLPFFIIKIKNYPAVNTTCHIYVSNPLSAYPKAT